MMWEWLTQGKNLQGLGSIFGAGGSIFGGLKQAESANKMIDLQSQQFNFNKEMLLKNEEDKKREEAAYRRAYGSGIATL